jgi:hypothetical protein
MDKKIYRKIGKAGRNSPRATFLEKKKIPKEIKTQVGIPESCKTIHSIR